MADLLYVNYLEKLKGPDFEKNIPYMYTDSEEKITVGVGHNLSAHGDHLKLPFKVRRLERHHVIGGATGIAITQNKVLGRLATEKEIQNDFDFLDEHTGLKKYAPDHLRKYTTLELDQVDIDALFRKDLDSAIATAKGVFANLDSFPLPCQAAIIDIAFNTGGVRFPTLVLAVKGQGEFLGKLESDRWLAASHACRRGQVSATRNQQVAQWFVNGSAEAKAKESRSPSPPR